MGKCDEFLEKNSKKLSVENPDILIVFQDNFTIVGISLVLVVVEMNTRNIYLTARRIQTRNVTHVSHSEGTGQPVINGSCYCNTSRHRPVMRARRQTLVHKQRMPTSQGGTEKYAFCVPHDGHFDKPIIAILTLSAVA